MSDIQRRSPMERHRKLERSHAPDVLLVEDVPVSKHVVKLSLARAHYSVDIVSSGEEALEKLSRQHDYKLVLMDIGLPGIDGMETTRRVRARETTLGLPPLVILGLTASVEPEQLRAYAAAGMNGCIMKGSIVADAVDRALRMHAEHPETFIDLTAHVSPHPASRPLSSLRLAPLSPAQSPLSPSATQLAMTPSSGSEDEAPHLPDPDQDAQMVQYDPLGASQDPKLIIARRLASGAGAGGLRLGLRSSVTATHLEKRDASLSPSGPAPKRLHSSKSYCESPVSSSSLSPPQSPLSPIGSPLSEVSALSPLSASSSSPLSALGSPDMRSLGTRVQSGSLSRSPSQQQMSGPGDYDCLLVEDVRVSQRVAQASLSRAGFTVDVAADGETAVAKFMAPGHRYRIILMDIGLPGISGIEACLRIRAFEKEQQRPPCIIFGLTGNTEEVNLHSYAEAGMNGCISKGSSVADALLDALEQLHKRGQGHFIEPGASRRSHPFKRTEGPSREAVEAANKILMASDDLMNGVAPSSLARQPSSSSSNGSYSSGSKYL